MMRSLFAGVSGLRNHQVRMDVIGNNIANVNTVAFKSGRVTFKEGFAQLLQGASRPPGDQGGTNPIQVGLGMQVGSIDQLFSQGAKTVDPAKRKDLYAQIDKLIADECFVLSVISIPQIWAVAPYVREFAWNLDGHEILESAWLDK